MILYEATCNAGVVSIMVEGITTPIPDCNILGAGKAPTSKGIVIADQDRFWFVPLVTPNLVSIIDDIIEVTDKLADVATTLQRASTLIDNASTAAGIAAFVPSVVTGNAIAADGAKLAGEIPPLKQKITLLKDQLV